MAKRLSPTPDSSKLPDPLNADPAAIDELHRALGKALTSWQYVETVLFLIAHCLMGSAHRASSHAFFHIKSAENKLTFVDRLLFDALPQRVWADGWKALRKDISALIEFRNALAHFEAFHVDGSQMRPPSQYSVAISTHHLDEHAMRGGTAKALSVEAINANYHETRRITYSLIYFLLDNIPQPQLERGAERLPQHPRQFLDSFRKTPRPPGFPPPR